MGRRKKTEKTRRQKAVRSEGRVKRVLAFILLFTLCAVFPIFVNDAIGYVPLAMLVFLVVVSFIYLRLLLTKFNYSQNALYHECTRGEEDQLAVTIKNTSPLLFFRFEPTFVVSDSELQDKSLIKTRTVLNGLEERDFGIDIKFDHIGMYSAGLYQAEIFDLLGLFSKIIRYKDRCTIRVVPKIHFIEKLNMTELTTSENIKNAKSVLSDDMNYAYVRDYEKGDPMKTIHWKISARFEDTLFTKLFESHTNPGITIFLDFYSSDKDGEHRFDMFDTMLESSFSLIDYSARVGIETLFVFRDANGEVRTTEKNKLEELDLMIDDMPRLNDGIQGNAAAEMLKGEINNPNGQANVFFFTSELSPENIDAISQVKQMRRNIKVFFVLPKNLASPDKTERLRLVERLTQVQVEVTPLEQGEDIWLVGA